MGTEYGADSYRTLNSLGKPGSELDQRLIEVEPIGVEREYELGGLYVSVF